MHAKYTFITRYNSIKIKSLNYSTAELGLKILHNFIAQTFSIILEIKNSHKSIELLNK